MQIQKIALLILVSLVVSGCATITRGTTETLQVEVANCQERIQCKAINKKGSWPFDAPGSVTVSKSDEALRVECKDENEVILESVSPVSTNMAYGNILFGGIIGGAVDASTDAHWELTDSITIHREYCNGEPIE